MVWAASTMLRVNLDLGGSSKLPDALWASTSTMQLLVVEVNSYADA